MRRMVMGVVGHVDHGKTALVRALTGTETDRLAEEKARGISIALGFAHLECPGGLVVDLIDMPGHERFVRTMIGGATGLDAILIVVAATEGVMPQTVEHVGIAGLLGITRAVVAVTKTDLADSVGARAVIEAGDAAVALARKAGMTVGPPVPTSATGGKGMDALRAALVAVGCDLPRHTADGIPHLPIDRAFGVVGHGPVVTGTLRGGGVGEGDVLELSPRGQRVRVKAVQVHGRRLDRAMPGQRVALNLRDVQLTGIARGMSLAAPGALSGSRWLSLALRSLDTSPPLRNGMRLQALFGTQETDARLRLLEGDELRPGTAGLAQLHFPVEVMVPAGLHVVLRSTAQAATLAGGRVLDPVTWRQRRNNAEVLARLRDLATLPPPLLIAAELGRAGTAGLPLTHLCRLTFLTGETLRGILAGLPVTEAGSRDTVVLADALAGLSARVQELLAEAMAPLSRDRLLSALPDASGEVLDTALSGLIDAGLVRRRPAGFDLCRPEQERARAREEEALARDIAAHLRAGGLTPELPEELRAPAGGGQLLNRLVREGVLVRTQDSGKQRGVLFHADAVEMAKARLARILADSDTGLRVGEIGPALGITRKYSVPLLAYLDSIRFTRRLGDRRVLYGRAAAASDHAASDHAAADHAAADRHPGNGSATGPRRDPSRPGGRAPADRHR